MNADSRLRKLRDSMRYRALRFRRRLRNRYLDSITDYVPVFVSGIMGSGSTLTARLIEQHFVVGGVANEVARQVWPWSPLYIPPTHRFDSPESYLRAISFAPDVSVSDVRTDLVKFYQGVFRSSDGSMVIIDKEPNSALSRAATLRRAFPRSTFILLIRDPVASVEGLRRKWDLFKDASLEETCDFWEACHRAFLEDSDRWAEDVILVQFEDLISATDATLEFIGSQIPLTHRDELRPYRDKPNERGFGLRNVRDGEILVAANANARAARLPRRDQCLIRERLHALHREMVERFGSPEKA